MTSALPEAASAVTALEPMVGSLGQEEDAEP